MPLERWNPEPTPEPVQLNFATLYKTKTPQIPGYPRVAFKLSCVNLNLLICFFFFISFLVAIPGFPSLD